MSKRARKVAFDEEIELAEKRRREEELYDKQDKRECALIGTHCNYTVVPKQQSLGSKLNTLWTATKRMSQIQCRRVDWEMKIWLLRKTQPL